MMSGPAHARVASASGSGIEGGEPNSELGSTSVQTEVGFSPPRSVNLPFCHLGLLKGRFSSL